MNRRDDWITELHYKEFVKPKLQQDDFYWEGGTMVMTENYHKKRGSCEIDVDLKNLNGNGTVKDKEVSETQI